MINRIQSLLIVKPDGVARGLIGHILTRFELKGFKLIGSKMVNATPDMLAQHYPEHYGKDYYHAIEKSMTEGPMFVFVLEGPDGTVGYIREMLGATNPMKADIGTIRGDFATDYGHNVCHASDSIESAKREIDLWFKKEELAFHKNSTFTS